MICSSCHQPLSEDALFCSNCGMATGKIDLRTTVKNSPETNPNEKHFAESGADPRVGLILDSKYELIERLGQGGMGSVYRARRLHIGDDVAVKLLSPELLREQNAIERFRREARSAALIRHPNVVSIHDFHEGLTAAGAKEAYIVMELVEGESLRQLLERQQRLPPERAVNLMLDICAGVGVAHRQGLLHRDLKPDNVIVTPPADDGESESAKVVDFGLAKVRDDVSPLTQTGTLLGTVYYMSPEQCRGDDLDARADVYSLGAMLYEMLSGQPPFTANNLTGLITKHLNEPPPTLDYSLGIPPALGAVCFRALAKNRDERQADALVFAKELKAAITSRKNFDSQPAIAAVTIASPEKLQEKWFKWALVSIPSLLLVITLGGLGVFALFTWRNLSNKATTEVQGENQQRQRTTTTPENIASSKSNAASVSDLRGNWQGVYGPFSTAATLVIKNHSGEKFDGVLEQGPVRVVFEGTIRSTRIQMRQTSVVSGDGWSLGEDTGTISSDGKRMSGTGKDALGGSLGLTYQWSFSR